jgi:type VI secretion system secreted protein VgrG
MASLADRLLANKRFEFSSVAFGSDKFAVVEMEGFEAISRPFRFTLTLVSDDASIDFDTMLRNPASFVIYSPDGRESTPYHGVLAEFDQLHRADGYVFYRVVLVPRLWRLSMYRISEAYLGEQPITTTLETVLRNGQLSSADYEFRLTGTYRPRTFVCQYEETHLDFVSRWMENEGIYYYFDHSGNADKLVAIDVRTMQDAQAVQVDYRPDDEMDTGTSPNSVRDFVGRQKPLPHDVILQDFNYRKAGVQMKAQALVSEHGLGQVMIYGENFRDEAEGMRYAKLRAEEILCQGRVFAGEATAVGLRSGYFAELSHHYRDDFNGRYLVTEIHHQGSQAGALLSGIRSPYSDGNPGGETSYRNSFRAIAAAVQFRPERVTPKPRVAGTMNATIDSEGSGEYAELDEFGQYKVQLPFDLTDKNANKGSARVRMATPYSGSNHGMHFPLHKDAEVLLSFIDGDPDRPVIVGTVPNSENRSIVSQSNPHENRITTAGGNQVYMSDTKGKEVMWLHSPFHNSTIGLGSTKAEGGGSVWTSTAGSSESVTVGVSNSIFAGEKNSATLSYESSLAASITNKFTLGASVNFGWSYDVTWKKGRGVTLDDSETVSLKTDGKLQANDTVTISGGQRAVIKTLVESLKTKVQVSVLLSLAVNAAISASAAVALDRTDADQTTGKAAPWTPGSYGVTAAQAGIGSLVTTMPVHVVLALAGRSIAKALAAAPAYGSNIKVNGAGIDMTVDTLVPLEGSNVKIEDQQVTVKSTAITVPGTSGMVVQPASISLTSGASAPLQSALTLTPASAKLSTVTPTGTVSLTHPVGGSAELDDEGLFVACGGAKLEVEVGQGVMMKQGVNSVSVTLNQVLATAGAGSMSIKPAQVLCELATTSLELTAVGLKVGGTLIQIG